MLRVWAAQAFAPRAELAAERERASALEQQLCASRVATKSAEAAAAASAEAAETALQALETVGTGALPFLTHDWAVR